MNHLNENKSKSIDPDEIPELNEDKGEKDKISKNTILFVDDDDAILNMVKLFFSDGEYDILTAENGKKALDIVLDNVIDVIVTDIKMPEMSGDELFHKINREHPHIPVILLSGQDDIQLAVDLIKEGVFYYFQKPVDLDQLSLIIGRALEAKSLERQVHYLRMELKKHYMFDNIIGKSFVMQEIFKTVKTVADSNATVLIQGESGTGKELVAQAIHYNSIRSDKNFVPVNCGAIPGELLESELFGYEKGAFTGAVSSKLGKLEFADGGTLFFDEIGEMPQNLQVKLLRFLQDRKLSRLGSTDVREINVRVLAATNKILKEEVDAGSFRKDLFYRLSVIPIYIPALKERKEDIPLLVQHFFQKYKKRENKKLKEIDKNVINRLMHYDWPGNIRELENIIERAVVICSKNNITVEDLPPEIAGTGSGDVKCMTAELPEEGITIKQMTRELIIKTLEKTRGNKSKAARMLGITRKALYARLKDYDDVEI